jgi:hypothetical protein
MYDYLFNIQFNPPKQIENCFDILSVIGRRPFVYSNSLVHSLHNYMPLCLVLLVMLFNSILEFIILFMQYLINFIVKLIKSLLLNNNISFIYTIFILFFLFSTVSAFNPNITLWEFDMRNNQLWGNFNNSEWIRISSMSKKYDMLFFAKETITIISNNSIASADDSKGFYLWKAIKSYLWGFTILSGLYLSLVVIGRLILVFLLKNLHLWLIGLSSSSYANNSPRLLVILRYICRWIDDIIF